MLPAYHSIIAGQKQAIAGLHRDLQQIGFGFEYPDEAFAAPDEHTEDYLAFFAAHGCPLPAAVAEFYRQIGSVNFIGWSSLWDEDEYPDALNVMPLAVAHEEFSASWAHSPEERQKLIEAYGGYHFPLSPDYFHKQNISGGMAYGFTLPTTDPDPPLLYMPWQYRFTEYLDLAISTGGFPGLGVLRDR